MKKLLLILLFPVLAVLGFQGPSSPGFIVYPFQAANFNCGRTMAWQTYPVNGSYTATLQDATSYPGAYVTFVEVGTGTIMVNSVNSDPISIPGNSAATTTSISGSQSSLTLFSIGGGWIQVASTNPYAPIIFGTQGFTATGTISSAGPSVVSFTGSTGSQTLTLPSTVTIGQQITVINSSSVSVSVTPNTGQTLNLTINTAGTLTVSSGTISVPSGGKITITGTVSGASGKWTA